MNDPRASDRDLRVTEQRNPYSEDIDVKSSLEIVEIISEEDQKISHAVRDAKGSIATAIDWVSRAFLEGGRLVYAGAGTSGRLAQLDAAECPPTFGVPKTQVVALIAGGPRALREAIEGVEDREDIGRRDAKKAKVTQRDVVIGISAGSTTRYVQGVLRYAKERGSKTVLITCAHVPEKHDGVDLVITMLTGAEIITGSTRMKAGTATKMVLNMISTGSMIRTGRTYGNLMVDLKCSNRKLVDRGGRIIQSLTRLAQGDALELLSKSGFHVKTALAMGVLGVKRREAEKLLRDNRGFLRRIFEWPHAKNPHIDAVFFDMDGTILRYALPTGFSTWAALGWAFQIYDEMEEWVQNYLGGKIPYNDIWNACARRIEGRTFEEIRHVLFPVAGGPPYSRGFVDCAAKLSPHYRLGIVSSGISIVSRAIQDELKLNFEVSNHFQTSQGVFNGKVDVHVPFDHKLRVVEAKATELGIDLKRVCYVGDSLNDVEVLKAVGLPVAYDPKKPSVEAAARGNVIGDFLQLPRLIEKFRPNV